MALRSRMSVSADVRSALANRISWLLSSFKNWPSAVNDPDGPRLPFGIRLLLEHNRNFGVIRFVDVNAFASPRDEHIMGELGASVGELRKIGLLLRSLGEDGFGQLLTDRGLRCGTNSWCGKSCDTDKKQSWDQKSEI